MKKTQIPFVLFLAFVGAFILHLGAQEVSDPSKIDTSQIFAESSSLSLVTVTSYKRLVVGKWFEMVPKDLPDRSLSATFSDDKTFAPENVTVVVKREPVVTKRGDDTWEITFK